MADKRRVCSKCKGRDPKPAKAPSEIVKPTAPFREPLCRLPNRSGLAEAE